MQTRVLLSILNGSGDLNRPFIVTRAMPVERMANATGGACRHAQDEMLLPEAQKQSLPIAPVSGEEAETIIAKMYAAPASLARKVKDVLD